MSVNIGPQCDQSSIITGELGLLGRHIPPTFFREGERGKKKKKRKTAEHPKMYAEQGTRYCAPLTDKNKICAWHVLAACYTGSKTGIIHCMSIGRIRCSLRWLGFYSECLVYICTIYFKAIVFCVLSSRAREKHSSP